jgi:DNA replication protein DnaC
MGEGLLRVWTAACDCERRARQGEAAARLADDFNRLIARLWAQAGIDELFEDSRLSNYEPVAGTEHALQRCRDMASDEGWPTFREAGRGLLLVGENGCGKTHLAVGCIRNLIWLRQIECLLVTMTDYFEAIRKSYSIERAGGLVVGDIQERAGSVDLLVLDDLGAERLLSDERGDWMRDRLYALVDRRYRRKLPILATTNSSDEDIEERLGARIFRRLMAMLEPVPITAGNYAEGR